MNIKTKLLTVCLTASMLSLTAAERYADRFVWVFGWGLNKDGDVTEMTQLLETAGQHGFNGAVFSLGLDNLCKQSDDYFRRLDQVKQACEKNHLELIPSVFSVGYGGGALSHDRNLAEGLPVEDAPFVVKNGEARLASAGDGVVMNGGFEEFNGKNARGFAFHDQPGEISFKDMEVKHGGNASLRLENFTANQHGHGRVMQKLKLQPRRCYRMSVWVKTDGLQPAGAFRVAMLAGERELAPREFRVPGSSDWRRISMLFNSLDKAEVSAYVGVWGAKGGKLWVDDWTVEEVGPVNLLRRPGTPVEVRSDDGKTTYEEGKDYARVENPNLQPWREDGEAARVRTLPGGRIKEGDHLRVSWYHSMVINESQVGVCMGEPALYEIYEHEAKLLAEKVRPRRVLLNMDEIRMGGTCLACRGRNMAELLGECITRQTRILRQHLPEAQVYIWSDMLDPHHNAHGNYYLVEGDYTGSWRHVPKDLVIAVWGGAPREKNLRFFAEQGFPTLVACYYDADDLNEVKGWLKLARETKNVRGFMYTPWLKKYDLLPAFGDLLRD